MLSVNPQLHFFFKGHLFLETTNDLNTKNSIEEKRKREPFGCNIDDEEGLSLVHPKNHILPTDILRYKGKKNVDNDRVLERKGERGKGKGFNNKKSTARSVGDDYLDGELMDRTLGRRRRRQRL